MNRRDKIGLAVAFLLGVLFNGIGTIIMVVRELYQSKKYGFAIETNDVVNYSIISSVGAILNVVLLIVCL